MLKRAIIAGFLTLSSTFLHAGGSVCARGESSYDEHKCNTQQYNLGGEPSEGEDDGYYSEDPDKVATIGRLGLILT